MFPSRLTAVSLVHPEGVGQGDPYPLGGSGIWRQYHSKLSKHLVKTPKLYFLDTGLAAYLTAWSTPATLEAGAMAGALFETWVGLNAMRISITDRVDAILAWEIA